MKTYLRKLNKGELYACQTKEAKAIFKDTEITLSFGEFNRKGFNPKSYYVSESFAKKNIKGKVIATISMSSQERSPILSFYVLRQDEWSDDIRKEFIQKFLPQIYDFYIERLQDKSPSGGPRIFKCVELRNGQLFLHTTTINK